MDTHTKTSHSQSGLAATIDLSLSDDRARLVGTCPTCGSRLSVEVREDGSHNQTVSCLRCRGLYRIESARPSPLTRARLSGLGVSYTIEGEWNTSAILEYLFDNVGPVDYVEGGFMCHPDDQSGDCPIIMVDESSRVVRFALFGGYPENQATTLIGQAVSEFGARFQLDLRPFVLDRLEYRDDVSGFVLLERRHLGAFWRERPRRHAHA